MFEKPKDWGYAPKSSWVSGTPIGQSDIRMPQLGDPGAHEDSSGPLSFGDDEEAGPETALYRGKIVSQCPAGTSNQSGVCMPDSESEASLESKVKAATRGQWGKESDAAAKKPDSDSFKRELPSSPKEADAQVRRLAKGGVKARNK
jgi:hypothetical protein